MDKNHNEELKNLNDSLEEDFEIFELEENTISTLQHDQ
jgi:hypothetical protein